MQNRMEFYNKNTVLMKVGIRYADREEICLWGAHRYKWYDRTCI